LVEPVKEFIVRSLPWVQTDKTHWKAGDKRVSRVGMNDSPIFYAYSGTSLLGSERDLEAAKTLAASGKRKFIDTTKLPSVNDRKLI
jgi:hypothetical protein